VNSLQTDVDAEAVGAPIQAYGQLQAGREFFTEDVDAEAVGAPIQANEKLQAGRESSTDRCRR
jgi:hypothetical protein